MKGANNMSTKCWYVSWNRPSKCFEGEKVGEFYTFPTEKLARKEYDKVKNTEGTTDVEIGETECCSL